MKWLAVRVVRKLDERISMQDVISWEANVKEKKESEKKKEKSVIRKNYVHTSPIHVW